MLNRYIRYFSVGALIAVTSSASSWAQASASGLATAADDEAVVLPAFTVATGKDNGYIAADTISGSRLSVNLLKTPADITSLTRQFIDDIAANNLNDAAIWLTNSAVTLPTERDFGTNITFRGLPTGGMTRATSATRHRSMNTWSSGSKAPAVRTASCTATPFRAAR